MKHLITLALLATFTATGFAQDAKAAPKKTDATHKEACCKDGKGTCCKDGKGCKDKEAKASCDTHKKDPKATETPKK